MRTILVLGLGAVIIMLAACSAAPPSDPGAPAPVSIPGLPINGDGVLTPAEVQATCDEYQVYAQAVRQRIEAGKVPDSRAERLAQVDATVKGLCDAPITADTAAGLRRSITTAIILAIP